MTILRAGLKRVELHGQRRSEPKLLPHNMANVYSCSTSTKASTAVTSITGLRYPFVSLEMVVELVVKLVMAFT